MQLPAGSSLRPILVSGHARNLHDAKMFLAEAICCLSSHYEQSMTTSVTRGVRSCSWQDEVDTDAGFLNTQPVSPEFAPIQSAGKGVKGKVSNFQKSLVHSIQWPKLHGRHFKIALALAESFVCSSIHDTTQHHY